MGTSNKLYEVTVTSEGRRVLAKYKEKMLEQKVAGPNVTVLNPTSAMTPQVVGIKADNKFLCGVDGNTIESHPPTDRGRLWMCNACGQVYCDSCLTSWPRTLCIGSICPAARQKIPLKTVLRKMGNW